MTLYQGFKRTASPRGEARAGTWRSRRSEAKSKKYFFSFGPVPRPAAPPVRTWGAQGGPSSGGGNFYRPGGFRKTAGEGPRAVEGTGRGPAGRSGRSVRKALGWALKSAAVALLLGTLVWSRERVVIVLQDVAGLKLNKVTVQGAHYLPEEEVVREAALAMGESMFRLDLEGALERVRSLAWVERVFIERRLPSSVVISIREREPSALVDHGGLFGLDAGGRLLPPSEALMAEDLPLLSGVEVLPGSVGRTDLGERFRPALELLAFLQGQDPALAQSVSEVNLAEPGALRVTFVDGLEAVFRPPVADEELGRLAMVLSDLSQKGKRAGTMDFRFRDMVVVRTRN